MNPFRDTIRLQIGQCRRMYSMRPREREAIGSVQSILEALLERDLQAAGADELAGAVALRFAAQCLDEVENTLRTMARRAATKRGGPQIGFKNEHGRWMIHVSWLVPAIERKRQLTTVP